MSAKERDRLKVMAALTEGRLKHVEAARLMKLSVRHVRRIQERYAAQGDAGLVHRSRDLGNFAVMFARATIRLRNTKGHPEPVSVRCSKR